MKLVGIKYKEWKNDQGIVFPKYECHLVDNRRLPGMTGASVFVYDVSPKILEEDFAFVIGGEYDFVMDEGKVVAVFDCAPAPAPAHAETKGK